MWGLPQTIARITVLVISLGLACLAGGQAFSVYVEGTRLNDPEMYNSGLMGLLVIPFYLTSVIFAVFRPKIAAKLLCVAGISSLIIALTTGFKSLALWGIVSLVASLLSLLGARRKKRVQLRVIPGGKARSAPGTRASVI